MFILFHNNLYVNAQAVAAEEIRSVLFNLKTIYLFYIGLYDFINNLVRNVIHTPRLVVDESWSRITPRNIERKSISSVHCVLVHLRRIFEYIDYRLFCCSGLLRFKKEYRFGQSMFGKEHDRLISEAIEKDPVGRSLGRSQSRWENSVKMDAKLVEPNSRWKEITDAQIDGSIYLMI